MKRRLPVVDPTDFPEAVVLDAGAFIGLERRDRTMVALGTRIAGGYLRAITSAAVVAEVWRGGERAQAPLAFLLRHLEVFDLTLRVAKALGRVLAGTRTRDPIDAHVALLAHERGWPVLTSHPQDLHAIAPDLVLYVV